VAEVQHIASGQPRSEPTGTVTMSPISPGSVLQDWPVDREEMARGTASGRKASKPRSTWSAGSNKADCWHSYLTHLGDPAYCFSANLGG
jgi:hypothetical protein